MSAEIRVSLCSNLLSYLDCFAERKKNALFYSEDGGSIFPGNVDKFQPHCMTSHIRRQYCAYGLPAACIFFVEYKSFNSSGFWILPYSKLINVYRLPQQTSLVPSTFATCFSHTDHSEAFQYMTLKTQNKMHTHGQ